MWRSDHLPSRIMTNIRSPWWSHGAYPKGKSFGEMLDWHLSYWGTRSGCSLEHRNECESVASIAAEFHDGIREAPTPTNSERKLANWRQGINAPRDAKIVANIFRYLFGDDDRLTEWRRDLEEALQRHFGEQGFVDASSESTTHKPADTDASAAPPQGLSEIDRVELKMLWSAGEDLNCIALDFSPTSDRIVTACSYKGAWLWNAKTGDAIRQLFEAGGSYDVAVFSPDGAHVLVQPTHYDLTLLDVADYTTKSKFRGCNAGFSLDGNQVVCAIHHEARIWDTKIGAVIASLKGHRETVRSAAFSPNGKFIVTASKDKTAIIWNASTDFISQTLRGHDDCVRSATFSPDSLRVVTASEDNTARIWSVATGEQILVLKGHERWVTNAIFSPDGRLVATSSRDGYVRFWNAETGRCLGVIRDRKPVSDVALSPSGEMVAVASPSGLRCFSLHVHYKGVGDLKGG